MVDSRTGPITFLLLCGSLTVGCGIPTMHPPQPQSTSTTQDSQAASAPAAPAEQGPSPDAGSRTVPEAANRYDSVADVDNVPSASGPAVRQTSQTAFHLSAGAALPQSLPMGTVMSFSVDYKQRAQPPAGQVRYLWIIKGVSGSTHQQPIALKSSGTLTAIVPGLRPEAGPFECHLAAVHGSRGRPQSVSNSVPLR